jgi:uncharacterized membrane protein
VTPTAPAEQSRADRAHPAEGADPLARGIGAVSAGLGLAQLLATDRLAREIGVDRDAEARAALRAVGVRELAVVPGLLRGRNPAPWLWARVAGDAVDLTLLGRALGSKRGERASRVKAALGAVAAVTALDLVAAVRAARRTTPLRLTAAITVGRPPQEVYRHWRDLENLPEFTAHLESVRVTGGGRSRWTARSPVGGSVGWDAEVTDDVPGERIAWRSVGRTRVPNSGVVRFSPAPGDRGTEVRVQLEYAIPGGRAGGAFARLLGEDPHQQVEDDLRRFKQVMEAGEVIRSDGSPGGSSAPRQRLQRPAQPSATR